MKVNTKSTMTFKQKTEKGQKEKKKNEGRNQDTRGGGERQVVFKNVRETNNSV